MNFVNTIHDWTVLRPRDYLGSFGDAVRFGESAGVLSRAEARRLAARPAEKELARLRELRARLERVFRAAVTAQKPSAADLAVLAGEAARAGARARLRPARARLERLITVEVAGAAVLRWRVVESAITLLTSAHMDRVKACSSCGWFFLDVSKNRSRRWCSMRMCGSTAKARRYYWRTKRRGGGTNGKQ